jgi:hypothetical protein
VIALSRAAGLLLSVAFAGSTVACGGTEPGDPTPQTSSVTAPTSRAETSSSRPTATTTAPGDVLASLDPCTLLSAAEATSLALPAQGRRQDIVSTLTCIWPVPGTSLTVTIDPTRGLADINTQTAAAVVDTTVGKHSGRRVEEISGAGYCGFDLAITANSSVSVLAIILNKTAEACALAQRAVAVVEPKLP